MKVLKTPMCPYCHKFATLVDGTKIYPHREDLANLKFWACESCNAYVGCHKPSKHNDFQDDVPLGRLADSELRHTKSRTHAAFDPLWKTHGMTRKEAYRWLAQTLNIEKNDCHIGLFDVKTCIRAIEASRIKLEEFESK